MNPYEVLGGLPTANEEEIRRAFNVKARVAYNKWVEVDTEKRKNDLGRILEAYIYINDFDNDKSFELSDNEYLQYLESRKQKMYEIMALYHWAIKEQKRKDGKLFIKYYIKGLLWICGGGLLSLYTYLMAIDNGGGTYFVLYGAMIYGAVVLYRTYRLQEEMEEMRDYETMLWIELR